MIKKILILFILLTQLPLFSFRTRNFEALNKMKEGAREWNNWVVNCQFLFLSEENFSRVNFNFFNFKGFSFRETFFDSLKMQNCNFESGSFDVSKFKNVDLQNSRFKNSEIDKCRFFNVNLKGIQFNSKYIAGNHFIGCNLENADFSNSPFKSTINPQRRGNLFRNSNLKGANFSNKTTEEMANTHFLLCNLENAVFRNADLHKVIFSRAYIKNADFTAANLDGAVFEKKWKKFLEKFKTSAKNWDKIKWVNNETDFNPYTNNALVIAAKNGNADECIRLLKLGALPDSAIDGVPALTWACYKGHVKIVELLIKNQADVNIVDRDIDTPLIAAAFGNKVEIVKLLLKAKKINVGFKNFANKTALDIAKEKGFSDIAQLLMTNQPFRIEQFNAALLAASRNGNLNEVKTALEKGANINIQDEEGRTALMIACSRIDIEMVKFLVAKGANANLKDRNENTALFIAYEMTYDNYDMVYSLIENGADIYNRNNRDFTLFSLAVSKNDQVLISYLIKRGVSHAVLSEGLIRSAEKEFFNLVDFFLKKGVHVDTQIEFDQPRGGKTPLMIAAYAGNIEFARFLLSRGANINAQSRSKIRSTTNYTPIMFAVVNGKLDMVKFLVSRGANIHAKDSLGNTVYALSIWTRNKEIAEYLKSRGAVM